VSDECSTWRPLGAKESESKKRPNKGGKKSLFRGVFAKRDLKKKPEEEKIRTTQNSYLARTAREADPTKKGNQLPIKKKKDGNGGIPNRVLEFRVQSDLEED